MAVITYKCDTCNREIEKPQNAKGMEIIDRCIITLGCRGKLFQTNINTQQVAGAFPADVAGLDNYSQRKVLFTHEQGHKSTTWNIKHLLGSSPSIYTHIYVARDDAEFLEEVLPKSIDLIDKDNVNITFEYAQKGIAQCLARSASRPIVELEAADRVARLISPESELTIATLRHDDIFKLELVVTLPENVRTETIVIEFSGVTTINSPWVATSKVVINGKIYATRSVSISNLLLNANVIDGSSFHFSRQFINSSTNNNPSADWIDINKDDIMLILSNNPHTKLDLDMESFLDTNRVQSAADGIKFGYIDENKMYTYEDLLNTTFPPLRVAVYK